SVAVRPAGPQPHPARSVRRSAAARPPACPGPLCREIPAPRLLDRGGTLFPCTTLFRSCSRTKIHRRAVEIHRACAINRPALHERPVGTHDGSTAPLAPASATTSGITPAREIQYSDIATLRHAIVRDDTDGVAHSVVPVQ